MLKLVNRLGTRLVPVCALPNTDGEWLGCVDASSGEYVSEAMPAGEYRVETRARGYIWEFYPGSVANECGNGNTGELVSIGPTDATGIDFDLDRGLVVRGSLFGADGQRSRLAFLRPTALDHDHYCDTPGLYNSPRENGEFELTLGGHPLAPRHL